MTTASPGLTDAATMVSMWQRMLRIRRFEEAATRLLRAGRMPGVLHNSTGQEAVIVGTSDGLGPDDYLVGTHRNHGYTIARGADPKIMMAEILGRATGVCGGKGGEMHLIAPEVGVFFNSAILASGLPIAVGTAVSAQMKHTGRVTLGIFGDGASNEGAVHESMNLASIWHLPIVFLCENNGYAVTVPASYAVSVRDIADRAAGYGMPGHIVEGHDPCAVAEAIRAAAEHARSGGGPSLVEAKTYRTVDHAENLPSQPYRSAEEVEEWRSQDPIVTFRRRLEADGAATKAELDDIAAQTEAEIAAAVDFALASPFPEPDALWADMYSDERLNRAPAF
jgi:acetoin:2,6-dichlorophenolindophenol oxidoreductase subunit alpha